MEHLERRAFLTISATSLAAAWAPSAATGLGARATNGKPIGDDTITMLEDSSRRLNSCPTETRQHVYPLLDAHLVTVTDLIENGRYDRPTGLRLHNLAASLAQTVAWHRFDHGRYTAAGKLWIAGLRSAHVTGDTDLGAAMLGDLACARPVTDRVPVRSAGVESKRLVRPLHVAG
ncbi:XRE family transcriptional regulator, partial [Streptomyces sp. NPDC087864]